MIFVWFMTVDVLLPSPFGSDVNLGVCNVCNWGVSFTAARDRQGVFNKHVRRPFVVTLRARLCSVCK